MRVCCLAERPSGVCAQTLRVVALCALCSTGAHARALRLVCARALGGHVWHTRFGLLRTRGVYAFCLVSFLTTTGSRRGGVSVRGCVVSCVPSRARRAALSHLRLLVAAAAFCSRTRPAPQLACSVPRCPARCAQRQRGSGGELRFDARVVKVQIRHRPTRGSRGGK